MSTALPTSRSSSWWVKSATERTCLTAICASTGFSGWEWNGTVAAGRNAGSGSLIGLEHRQERFLRDLHRPHHLHPLLAFLLLLEQLALARDVAAVALGGDVLAEGVDRRAGDDRAADRPLDGDLELLLGDGL